MNHITEVFNFGNSLGDWIKEEASNDKYQLIDYANLHTHLEKIRLDPSIEALKDLHKVLVVGAGLDASAERSGKKRSQQKENEGIDTISVTSSTNASQGKHDVDDSYTSTGRPRRKAFQDASERVNAHVNISLNTKLRQPRTIKQERISELEGEANDVHAEMPPPAAPAKRGRKKKEEQTFSRQTRTASANQNSETVNEIGILTKTKSDVILVGHETDNESEIAKLDEEEQPEAAVEESGKGQIKEVSKRTRSPSDEPKKTAGKPKRTKRKISTHTSPKEANSDDVSSCEGAEPMPDIVAATCSKVTPTANETVVVTMANPNATIVLKQAKVLDTTVTVAKPTIKPVWDELMTDDESDRDDVVVPIGAAVKVGQQLFNPFENSPVKKKVEAFEQLGAAAASAATNARVTRTKTRQKAKAVEDEKVCVPREDATPQTTHRAVPALASVPSSRSHLSDSAKKTLNAIKLSSQQFRDQQRKEKDAEALRKKEALLAKQSEEKRRKREEKEAKAKLQREQLEREKRRAMEQQKAKEEKQAQMQQEKQERANKQREETERRRLLVKQKYEEIKREEERKRQEAAAAQKRAEEEERRRLEEEERRKLEEERRAQALRAKQMQKEMEAQSQALPPLEPPVYMTTKAPLLPTPDCYDSDDEKAPKRPELRPWNTKEAMRRRLQAMSYIDAKVRNTLFCLKPQTPNLAEVFPNVNPRRLRRNSSAVWTEAPRFTMMPVLDEDF